MEGYRRGGGVQEEGGGTLEVVDTWTDCWAGGCWD